MPSTTYPSAMPRTTTRGSPKAVVLARETDRLAAFLRLRQSIDAAVASGRVCRTKIAGSWLYHPAAINCSELVEAAASEADRLLAQRLIVPLSVMAGRVSASIDPPTSKGAARALLHHLVAAATVARLGLLTAQDEPHLALYRQADTDEITRQLNDVRSALDRDGEVGHRQLPEPAEPRQGRAWAVTLIEHAEFAGWGHVTAGDLRAWPQP
jgi:hypothetical protein